MGGLIQWPHASRQIAMIDADAIKARFERLLPFLDERARRLFAANEAMAAGWGGGLVVSAATGVARSTVVLMCVPQSLAKTAASRSLLYLLRRPPTTIADHRRQMRLPCHGHVGYVRPRRLATCLCDRECSLPIESLCRNRE